MTPLLAAVNWAWVGAGVFLGALLLGGLILLWLKQRRARLRKLLRSQGLTRAQLEELKQLWPLFAQFPESMQARIAGWSAVFLEEVRFEACGELDAVDEQMRLLIAAQACLLLSGQQGERFYPKLQTVLVYPSGYYASDEGQRFGLGHAGASQARLGESWDYGSVVLGWAQVRQGAQARDGLNLVLHEFAHQLDFDGGPADGAPRLDGFDARRWQQVFCDAWALFHDKLEEDEKTVIDDYGATNPAEFYAVAVETFFERGKRLQREYPDLYAVLSQWFACEPATW